MMTNRHVAFSLGALLLLTACSWDVPADPGLNTQLRGGQNWVFAGNSPQAPELAIDPSAASDTHAQNVYLRKCSQCHDPIHPTALTAGEWPAAVNKYGPMAGLFGAERKRVLNWLMANAGR